MQSYTIKIKDSKFYRKKIFMLSKINIRKYDIANFNDKICALCMKINILYKITCVSNNVVNLQAKF